MGKYIWFVFPHRKIQKKIVQPRQKVRQVLVDFNLDKAKNDKDS